MFTAEQARDLAREWNGSRNIHSILRQIRDKAKHGAYWHIIWMKEFKNYICSREDIQKLGYKTEVKYDSIYQEDYLEISWS